MVSRIPISRLWASTRYYRDTKVSNFCVFDQFEITFQRSRPSRHSNTQQPCIRIDNGGRLRPFHSTMGCFDSRIIVGECFIVSAVFVLALGSFLVINRSIFLSLGRWWCFRTRVFDCDGVVDHGGRSLDALKVS